MAEGRTQEKGDGGKAAAKEPLPTTESQREDGRYEVDYLIRNSQSLLGERQAIVAGALARGDNKTYTLEQAEALLEKHRTEGYDPNEGAAA